MSDWGEATQPSPPLIHSLSQFTMGTSGRGISAANTIASTTWTANLAVYIPLFIPFSYKVERMYWANGSVIGSNVDCGIYSVEGTLITSTGSTAQSGTSAIQFQALSGGAVLLTPGRYYMAYSCNGTTNRAFTLTLAAADGELMGLQQQGTAFALPATMTAAAYAGAGLPFMGITRAASGF